MQILFLTQYYPPEVGAAQNRLSDLARRLAASGHQVTVVTTLPSYPKSQVFDGYRGKLLVEEVLDGVRVLRIWSFIGKSRSFVPRLANYFSFAIGAILLTLAKVGQTNVIIVESPPLFLGCSGVILKIVKHSKLVFNVSDLWPESAVALGILKNKRLIHLSEKLERFIYRHSDVVTGQTQGIVDSVESRMPSVRVRLLTNGVDAQLFSNVSAEDREHMRAAFGWQNAFIVGYAGLHGIAQGLETVLMAAERLSSHPEIRFVLFGDGPTKQELLALAQNLRLPNIQFHPVQPKAMMPRIMSALDAAIVPLKSVALFRGALPCKLFEAMAAGLPIVLSIDGEARNLLERAQAGVWVTPENSTEMADAILLLARDPIQREIFGRNGSDYVTRQYNRAAIADAFEHFLSSLVANHPSETEAMRC